MITIKQKGDFSKTTSFLKNASKIDHTRILTRYGIMGVNALSAATPKDTGKTSSSWSYEITTKNGKTNLIWSNSNMAGDVPVVILLQYGHALNDGRFISGYDFINPALQDLFSNMANDAWKEVINL